MLKPKKKSKWEFETSASAGAMVLFVGAGKGSFTLTSPYGAPVRFNYAYLGGGYGKSIKGLPVVGKVSGAVATEEMASRGSVYILESFRGDELAVSDLTGMSLIVEGDIGLGYGASGVAMLLGIPPTQDAVLLQVAMIGGQVGGASVSYFINPDKMPIFRSTAKAVLFFRGENSGLQAGASILGSLGLVWVNDMPDLTSLVRVQIPGGAEGTLRSSVKGKETVLEVLSDVLFPFDEDWIDVKNRDALRVLTKVGNILKSKWGRRVRIVGHADSIGERPYNRDLSERRARNVLSWLVQNGYVKRENVSFMGYGEDVPVASNQTPQGRAKNRRVVIYVN